MEYGARALGYRSIIADPTSPSMKELINRTIKFREGFRPFAPSVIEEEAGKYFELQEPVPFMTTVCSVTEYGRQCLPAVTHVDGPARVHTVSKRDNPRSSPQFIERRHFKREYFLCRQYHDRFTDWNAPTF